VSSDNNGLSPTRDKSGDVLDNNGFSEDSTIQLVSDGTVGGEPHLFEIVFLNSSLIRSDGSALNTNLVFLDSSSSVNGDLIVGGISVFNTQIKISNVDI
jgi:hypothetical protein